MNILISSEESKVIIFLNSDSIILSCVVRYILSYYAFTDGNAFSSAYHMK